MGAQMCLTLADDAQTSATTALNVCVPNIIFDVRVRLCPHCTRCASGPTQKRPSLQHVHTRGMEMWETLKVVSLHRCNSAPAEEAWNQQDDLPLGWRIKRVQLS